MPKEKSSIIIGKGDHTAEVFPRKSRMAKRIIIRFSERSGFELIVPVRVSMQRAVDFLYRKEDWVLEKSREVKQKNRVKFVSGAQVPILGNNYTITHSGHLRGITRIEGESLIVSGLLEHIPRKTKQFLIKYAKEEITKRAVIDANNLGVKFFNITVRDTSTRWGSCSKGGNLSFSWRLVLAPREVLEYVVAHELAHLREMNHSKKFWKTVASIFPHYQLARGWLRKNGGKLHSYGD